MWPKEIKLHLQELTHVVDKLTDQDKLQANEIKNQAEEIKKIKLDYVRLFKYVKAPAIQLDTIKKNIFELVRLYPSRVKDVVSELEYCIATLKKQEAQGELIQPTTPPTPQAPADKDDLYMKLDLILNKMLSEQEMVELRRKVPKEIEVL